MVQSWMQFGKTELQSSMLDWTTVNRGTQNMVTTATAMA